jgi:hypothetical protein
MILVLVEAVRNLRTATDERHKNIKGSPNRSLFGTTPFNICKLTFVFELGSDSLIKH